MYQRGIVCGKILCTYFREAYFQLFNINKEDVGIMGFSAGGHLASSVSTHAE